MLLQAALAEQYGCIGLILYSDPANYAMSGLDPDVYPDSWFLPGSGVQRGSLNVAGDVLTPGYPSISKIRFSGRPICEFPVLASEVTRPI